MGHGILQLRPTDGQDGNTATDTAFTFDVQDIIDTDFYTHTLNQSQVYFKKAGFYRITTNISYDIGTVTAAQRCAPMLKLKKNGTTFLNIASRTGYIRNNSAIHETVTNLISFIVEVADNEYIEVIGSQAPRSTAGVVPIVKTESILQIDKIWCSYDGTANPSGGYDGDLYFQHD